MLLSMIDRIGGWGVCLENDDSLWERIYITKIIIEDELFAWPSTRLPRPLSSPRRKIQTSLQTRFWTLLQVHHPHSESKWPSTSIPTKESPSRSWTNDCLSSKAHSPMESTAWTSFSMKSIYHTEPNTEVSCRLWTSTLEDSWEE